MLNVRVVKIGGNELDRPGWLDACARAVAEGGRVVVVHGGGRAVNELCGRLGLPVEKRDGLRVTTPEIAAAVEMVMSGPVNRAVVLALRRAGLDAVGISGMDGGLLAARRLDPALGEVGEIADVRTGLLESMLLAGLTPVVCPVSPEQGTGAVLNVNADSAAAAVAAALRAAELLVVSDVPGVSVDGAVRRSLPASEVEALIAAGAATAGMAAKLRAAALALAGGAQSVRIGDLGLFAHADAGTRIRAAAARAA